LPYKPTPQTLAAKPTRTIETAGMTLGGTVSHRYTPEPKDEFDPLRIPLCAPLLAVRV